MDADGSNAMRLTFDPAADNKPAWSPDGRKIAFHHGPAGSRDIYVMNADGSGPTQLTVDPGDDIQADWQPCNDHVHGGGWVEVGRSRVTFNVGVGIDLGETRPEGYFRMIDHSTGTRVLSTSIDVYEWSEKDVVPPSHHFTQRHAQLQTVTHGLWLPEFFADFHGSKIINPSTTVRAVA
jgi:hypothetical protein